MTQNTQPFVCCLKGIQVLAAGKFQLERVTQHGLCDHIQQKVIEVKVFKVVQIQPVRTCERRFLDKPKGYHVQMLTHEQAVYPNE